ncbi:MAG: pyrroline-5-carboxylate reductase [Notoacmeibacter sp.]|nr:pyrroline-5-carboxylate reductase [Notoacmeibacter sp.]
MTHSLVLIGCGNMGFAMLKGWLEHDPTLNVQVVEPFEAFRDRAAAAGATTVPEITDLPRDLAPDLVVLAVKPQMIAPVLHQCGDLAKSGAAFISVAAGITIAAVAAALPQGTPIIRCMPNTPAAIGEGMMVLCAAGNVSQVAKTLTESLLSASGAVAWIDNESLMDAVTAISGSGPAYVFHFIEALTTAGQDLGLPKETASLLARQTVAGAGRMAQASEVPPAILREQVTSPGGTTAAALAVFMNEDRLRRLVAEAATAARDRSIELGRKG